MELILWGRQGQSGSRSVIATIAAHLALFYFNATFFAIFKCHCVFVLDKCFENYFHLQQNACQ